MLTEWRLEDLIGKRKYIYEVRPPFAPPTSLADLVPAIRKPICRRILGKLRFSCL